jgi:hypothetical protein
MSPKLIMILFFAFVLWLVVREVLRAIHRRRSTISEHDPVPTTRPEPGRTPSPHACSACGGFGFVTQTEPAMETRMEPQTEFYTDYSGRTATRMITRPRTVTVMKTVRVPCGFCGGSGRTRL